MLRRPRNSAERPDAGAAIGGHHRRLHEPRRPLAEDLEELGLGAAGAQRADSHVGAGELRCDSLAEVAHVGFAGRVGRIERHRHVSADGRYVEHVPASSREHGREEAVRELGQRHDVELDLLGGLLPGQPVEALLRTEAGVVDEDVDRLARALGRLEQRERRVRLGEVERDRGDLDPVRRLELLGEGRAVRTRSAPAFASCLAKLTPIPLLAPVTSAVRPLRFIY